ncbi:MAG: hypothetical protein ACPGJS_05700 [Flammeovirgaceae bacterium]
MIIKLVIKAARQPIAIVTMVRAAALDHSIDLSKTLLYYQVPATLAQLIEEKGLENALKEKADELEEKAIKEIRFKIERNEGYLKLLAAHIRKLNFIQINGNAKSETVINQFMEGIRDLPEAIINSLIHKLSSQLIASQLKIKKESEADLLAQLAYLHVKGKHKPNYIKTE